MTKVIVYSTPTCGYCHMVKDWFKENNVAFEEFDVAADEAKRDEMMKKTGSMAVPVIEVIKDGAEPELVIGFDKSRLSGLLDIK